MKKELLIFLFICPLVFVYVFSSQAKKSRAMGAPKVTMQDSFEQLLGKNSVDWNYIQTRQDVQDLDFYKTIYKKNINYQYDSSPIFRIPKIVHLIWLGPRSFPIESVENIRTWQAHHPDWTFCFWTDRKRMPPCNNMKVIYIKDFEFKFLQAEYEESRNWGEKSDILRYEILYQKGGVYIDHDANCLRPFHGLHTGYDFYACLEMPHEEIDSLALTAGIGIIGAKPYHPVIRGAIQMISDRWKPITERFKGTDPLVQARLVSYRTYIALTLALRKNLNLPGNRDIIFPACYFYPKHGLPGFYSQHFYGTTWNNLGETPVEQQLMLKLRHLRNRDAKIIRVEIISLIAIVGCFILYFLMNQAMKKGARK
ncbi:MAG: hypothetical protein KDK59_03540 [Simkania sp.]|nr:hypothetical protein [Simkania sp.]